MKSLRTLLFLLIGVGAFCIFLYWSFPYDRLKNRLVTQAQRVLGSGLQLEVETLQPNWVTGLELTHVTLRSTTDTKAPPLLAANAILLRASIFSALFGHPWAHFRVELAQGLIEGSAQQQDEGVQITLAFSDVALHQFGVIHELTGLRLEGRVDGESALLVNSAQFKQSHGTINLQLTDWKIAKQSQIKLGPLGAIDLKEKEYLLTHGDGSAIDVEIDGGKAEVTNCTLKGGDLQLDIKGQAFLEQQFALMRLNLKGKVGFSDSLRQLVPVAMFGAASPDNQSYSVELSGPIRSLRKKIGTFSF